MSLAGEPRVGTLGELSGLGSEGKKPHSLG